MEQKPHWYKKHKLKHITGFVTQAEKDKLKKLADLSDKSLQLYVTRVLQKHIKDSEQK
jgi:hypothetical protein